MKKPKNSIRTPSYFCKRLKDNGFFVFKIFNAYSPQDPRRWTVMIDPGVSSIFITCYTNKDFDGDIMFEFSDGGLRFPKNFSLKTESIETVISYLIRYGVSNNIEASPFYKSTKYKYNTDERKEEQQ